MAPAEMRFVHPFHQRVKPRASAFAGTTRALVFLLLAGSATLPGGNAVAAGELPEYEIVVRDGVFSPGRIEVPAGRRVRLILVNEGPGPLEFENDEMRIEKVLSAGARSFVVLPQLKPGEHEFVDEFNPITGVLKVIAR